MAFLDSNDTVERLYALIPQGWFPDLVDAPDLQAILSGIASGYSTADQDGIYQMLQYLERQTRVSTATGFWLDLIAQDFFGTHLTRNWPAEPDSSFRRRIMLNLLAPRGSRCALFSNVTNLTGYYPQITELRNTGDCGSYSSLANPVWGGCAYNEIGAYGTLLMPYQLLIKVTRPFGEGIPNVNGYGMSGGGYAELPRPFGYVGGLRPIDWGNGEYVQLTDIIGPVTDQNIYDTIAHTMPAACVAWTNISDPANQVPPSGVGLIDSNFYVDFSLLAPDDVPSPGGLYGEPYFQILIEAELDIGDLIATMVLPLTIEATAYVGSANSLSVTMELDVAISANIQTPSDLVLPFIIEATLQQPGEQPLLGKNFVLGKSTLGWIGANAVRLPVPQKAFFSVGSFGFQLQKAMLGISFSTAIGIITTRGQNVNTNVSGAAFASNAGSLTETESRALSGNAITSSIGTLGQPKVSKSISSSAITVSVGGLTTTSGVPATWSSTHKNANIVLSNGNDTATQSNATSTYAAVYGSKTASSGKLYWEIAVTTTNINEVLVGLGCSIEDTSDGTWIGSGLYALGWNASDGGLYNNNAALGVTWASWTSGQRLCLAVDLANKLIWGRVGNGNWNNSGTANPATGTGGYSFASTGNVGANPPWTPGASVYTQNDAATGYFSAGSWTYTAPAGFGQW